MGETNKILLNKYRFYNSINTNSSIDFGISNNSKPIPLNDITETVSEYEQFLKERQESSIYRFYGVVSPFVSNTLFNENIKIYTDNNGDIVSKKIMSSDISEKNGWVGYYNNDPDETALGYNDNKSSLCQFFPFDPGYDRLKILDDDGKPNYLLKITYPYVNKDIVIVKNNSNISLKDGVPIIDKFKVTINNKDYVGFKTAFNHGLTENSKINLYNFIDNTQNNNLKFNTLFKVYKLGNETNDNKLRTFILDINPNDISFNIGISTIKRVVNDTPSKYYVRRFKSLTLNYNDYDMYPAAFGKTYFSDNVAAFNFKKDIIVSGLTDNLGRPISELYFTILKNDNDSDPTGVSNKFWLGKQKNLPAPYNTRFWTKITAGYDLENNSNINYNIRAYGDPNYNGNTWFENIDESDINFDGDICEYNDGELYERTLELVYHRFNTTYREFNNSIDNTKKNKKEGYIYTPFNLIRIREFSNYIHPIVNLNSIIEKYNITNPIEILELKKSFRIPDYATQITTNVYKWRDLMDIGEIDSLGRGVDYPFESGAHYINLNNRFYLQRQDPPCNYNIITEEVTLGGSDISNVNRDKFISYLGDPTFLNYDFVGSNPAIYNKLTNNGVTNISNYNGTPDLIVNVNLGDYVGEYELGKRDIVGGCVDFSAISKKEIDDVC